jgi:hypothetical protein
MKEARDLLEKRWRHEITLPATNTSIYLQPNLELFHALTLDYQRLLYMILDVLLELDACLKFINDARDTAQAK